MAELINIVCRRRDKCIHIRCSRSSRTTRFVGPLGPSEMWVRRDVGMNYDGDSFIDSGTIRKRTSFFLFQKTLLEIKPIDNKQ